MATEVTKNTHRPGLLIAAPNTGNQSINSWGVQPPASHSHHQRNTDGNTEITPPHGGGRTIAPARRPASAPRATPPPRPWSPSRLPKRRQCSTCVGPPTLSPARVRAWVRAWRLKNVKCRGTGAHKGACDMSSRLFAGKKRRCDYLPSTRETKTGRAWCLGWATSSLSLSLPLTLSLSLSLSSRCRDYQNNKNNRNQLAW